MRLEDIDIDDLIDDDIEEDDDVDLSDRHEAQHHLEQRLEQLAGKLYSDATIRRLQQRLYLISRLMTLGVNRRDLIDDYTMLYPPPQSKGNNKLLARYETERDGLIDIARDLQQ